MLRYPFDRLTVLSSAEGLSMNGSGQEIVKLFSRKPLPLFQHSRHTHFFGGTDKFTCPWGQQDCFSPSRTNKFVRATLVCLGSVDLKKLRMRISIHQRFSLFQCAPPPAPLLSETPDKSNCRCLRFQPSERPTEVQAPARRIPW